MSHPPPSEPRLFTEQSSDDTLEVWLDGEVIDTFTYDQVGYAGMEAIKNLIDKIAADL